MDGLQGIARVLLGRHGEVGGGDTVGLQLRVLQYNKQKLIHNSGARCSSWRDGSFAHQRTGEMGNSNSSSVVRAFARSTMGRSHIRGLVRWVTVIVIFVLLFPF